MWVDKYKFLVVGFHLGFVQFYMLGLSGFYNILRCVRVVGVRAPVRVIV